MTEKTDQDIIKELDLEQEDNYQNDTQENEDLNIEEKEEITNNDINDKTTIEKPLQKKKPKIFNYLITIIAALSIILTFGVILYLVGFFDGETKKEELVKAKPIEIKKEPKIDIGDLDKNRLNQKFKMLTKTEILNKEELELEEKRILEEKRKNEEEKNKKVLEAEKLLEEKIAKEKEALQKEKELLEQRQLTIKKEQEEFLKLQEQIKKDFEKKREELFGLVQKQENNTPKNNDLESNEESNKTVEEIVDNAIKAEEQKNNQQNIKKELISETVEKDSINTKLFLPFINVAIIKGDLKKTYLDKIQTYEKKISLCRDAKNRIEIYFGPYESTSERNKIFNTLIDEGFKDSFLVDFTKEEYEKRCNY